MDGWLHEHAVIVEDGLISAVPSKADLGASPEGAVYQLGDVALMPGLVEAHSHMHCSATHDALDLLMSESTERLIARATTAVRRALMSGVTTMRDLGTRNEVAFPVRSAIEDGAIPGPRLLVSGNVITNTAGHCWFFGTEADTKDQVVQAVRRQVRLGADVIKIMASGGNFTPTSNTRIPQYPVDTLRAAVEEAERGGLQIAAHTHAAVSTRRCVEAGVHHLIHGRFLSDDTSKGFEYEAEVGERIARDGRWVDPTVGADVLRAEAYARGAPQRKTHWSVLERTWTEDEVIEVLVKLRASGVRFTSGLDMGMAYAEFDRSAASAWVMVERLGYSNWEALRAATSETAGAIGVGDVTGALRPGLAADMASFRGDPASHIRDLGIARDVIRSGRAVKLSGEALA